MNSIPYYYQTMNIGMSAVNPSMEHIRGTGLYHYATRYLIQRLMSVYKIKIPESWDKDFMSYALFLNGFVCVLNTDKYGIIVQNCTLGGCGIFYQPTYVLVANPLLNTSKQLRIGVHTELIKMQPDYRGAGDIIDHYACLMALMLESITVNLFNTKLAYIFVSGNEAKANTAKALLDDIMKGKLVSVVGKDMTDPQTGKLKYELFNRDIKSTYVVDQMLVDLKKIVAMFDEDVGIPNANTEKKERLITNEVESNNIATYSLADLWLEHMKEGAKKVNNMFGLNISFDWRFPHNEGKSDPEGNVRV